MSFDKVEIWVHDHLLKNEKLRHALYGVYQRGLYLLRRPKKCVGQVQCLSAKDDHEYFFGYYDKSPLDSQGKRALMLQVSSATKCADSVETANILVADLETGATKTVAQSRSWNVQQGCMLQWLDDDRILYNDFREDRHVSVVLNLTDGSERIIDCPVYAVSEDKKTALSLDFARLHRLRPGYGYANAPEATEKELCPEAPCIWHIDLTTGDVKPVLNYTHLAALSPRPEMEGAEHKVNHLMISPNGQRFMVLHRWFQKGVKYTRLVTASMDGTEPYVLADDDFVSHCCWKDDEHILSYMNKNPGGKGYYLMTDRTNECKRMWSSLAMDGHPTYSPDGKYTVTDTYPNRTRVQSLYVMKGGCIKPAVKVFSPFKYGGDVRCDLHPRWVNGGKQICFDATFEGKRRLYITDNPFEAAQPSASLPGSDAAKLVSIIMPCYNCEALLEEALESLENQTRKDFRLICVNDGSTDGTAEILSRWQEKGSIDITVIHQENGGVSRARNRGLEEADTKWVSFLDADDIYHPAYLEKLLGAAEEGSSDTAYCPLSRNLEQVWAARTDVAAVPHTPEQAMEKLLYHMGQYGFYCYLYRRDLLGDQRFDENTKFGEDREFNWRYLSRCKNIVWVDAPLYGYRINNASATQRCASWRKTDLLLAVKRVEAYMEETGYAYRDRFCDYMFPRAMWAVAKTFANARDRSLFDRLGKEYDVKKCMKRTAKDKSKLVAIASRLYLISPGLFYTAIGMKK